MFELPEDVKDIQGLARDFARKEILPGAAARDRAHAFPGEIVKILGEMGFMGMFVPAEYGGSGLSTLAYVTALEEICYADASVGGAAGKSLRSKLNQMMSRVPTRKSGMA